MADITKKIGKKGTSYQVRYATKARPSGYGYRTFPTLKEAREFRENSTEHKRARSGSDIRTVPAAIEKWLDVCEKIGRDGREKVEPETLKDYERRAAVMREYDWNKPLDQMRSSDAVEFRNWLLENKSRDLARRTLSSFHSVIIEMKRLDKVDSDFAAGVTIRSDGRYENDEEVEIPSDDEVSDLLAAADAMVKKNDYMEKCWARYQPLIYLAAFSGMRPSEYRGLPWSSVSKGQIQVRQRADKTGIIGPVKSKAGRRTLVIPTLVTDLIFEWQERCPKSEAGLVFPTDTGKPIALNNFVAGAWNPLLREAGLFVADMHEGKPVMRDGKPVERPKYSPYCLRHYTASKLIEKNKDAKYIQSFMGHSDIKITYNVYGHLMKGRDTVHRQIADEIAHELLNRVRRGSSVAEPA
ncbi:MAG: site-specific integrase [Mesorhizobium sp.]